MLFINSNHTILSIIGRRGPSTLIYEPIFIKEGNLAEDLKHFRKQCELTRWDVAMISGIPELSVYKIEQEKLVDTTVYRLVLNYLSYPQLVLDQLMQTGKKVYRHTRTRAYRYFKSCDKSGILK